MAWIRQLPRNRKGQALWAATCYTPLGDRITESHENKKFIENWARKMEADKDAGTFIDPRLGKTTVGEIWDLYAADRRLEQASHKRDQSHWNKWVAPTWAKRPVGPIRKPHVSGWVVEMERAGAKGWTTTAALNVLRSMLEIAVDLGLIGFNATRGVKVAPPAPHTDRVLEEWEDPLLLDNLDERFPGRPEAGLFVETLAYTGLRYEELAAMDRAHVLTRTRSLSVARVMEKDGTVREYPKADASVRQVAVDDDLWPRLLEHVMTVEPGGLVFTAPGGGPLLYDNWRKRTWVKGLLRKRPMSELEIEAWKQRRRDAGERPWKADWSVEEPLLDDPQPTPHDLRHTFGTRLADSGMPEKDIAAVMGHSEKGNATKRYMHPRERRHDQTRSAMASVRRMRRAS